MRNIQRVKKMMGLFDLFKKGNSPSPKKLIKAAKNGNLELVNSLLENGTDVNSRNEKDQTPLMFASVKDVELIKILH
jgi:ankyrin repeat protein